jgi:predicted permease
MQLLDRLFSRGRRYGDLSVSIHEHIDELTEELVEEGMSRPQAEQEARRRFGNVTHLTEQSRAVWQWPAAESILADLKFAFRRLRKSPGFAITTLLTLAIGIGANTAVFSVVNSVLLKPLAYPDPDRLVALWLDAPGAGGLANFRSGLQLSQSLYVTFSQHNQTFQSMGIWEPRTVNVTGTAQPEELQAQMISDGVLESLGVPAAVGRWFLPAEQDPHGAKKAILSYGYWQRRFGGDPGVIGRVIQVDSLSREIVGVMPRGFRFIDRDFDLLLPMAVERANLRLAGFGNDGVGRLKPGVSLAQANADIARLVPVWMDSWSNGPGTNSHWYEKWKISPNFRALKQQVIGNIGSVLWVVMATVELVMLIACTNVANLLLVRAESRHQELAIRAALGAGRWRIARELLIESIVLGLLGGVFAVGVAYAGLRLLVAIGPADLPRLSEVSLDWRSLCFTFVISILSGLLFGSITAFKYARQTTSSLPGSASRTASAGRSQQRSRDVLVIAQVAMALVLLVSAMLMIRTFAALRDVEPGFSDPSHLQTMRILIPEQLISDARIVTRTENEIVDKIAAIPEVTSVGFADALPMQGYDPNWNQVYVEGKNDKTGDPPLRLFNYVSPGYFHAMETRLVAGRDFTWTDNYDLRPTVMVSENYARESWGSASAAVGKRIREFPKLPWSEVIGVVEDVRVHGVDEKAPAIIYWPALLNNPYSPKPAINSQRFVCFAIRSDRAGTESLLNQLQQAVSSVNASLPAASLETMQEIYGQSLARTSFTLAMLAIAGSMALLLGIIGIYGVISYAVSQRTREIGIRLALGARKGDLRWMFVRSALMLTGIGVAIGLGAAAGLTQMMKSLLFGVSPIDPLSFLVIPFVLIAAAALASYLPAYRAASVDPVEALRAE